MTQESADRASAENLEKKPDTGQMALKERYQILRSLPGGLQRRQYLAKDAQADTHAGGYVLFSVAKWEQESALEQEYAISQKLHEPKESKHIARCYALHRGPAALDCLASLSADDYDKLSRTHCTELVLVSEFVAAIGRPEQAAETLQYMRRLLHIDGVSLPSGELLRGSPQAAFLFELLGRDMAALLQELATAEVVHGELQPQKLALCIDASALITGFQEGQQQTFIKAADLSSAQPLNSPVKAPQRDLPFQSPQRLGGLLGGGAEPQTARLADDVFALGAILYVLLTGEPPYTASHELPWFERARALHSQWTKEQAAPALKHNWIEPDILDAIQAMCAFAEEDRPAPAALVESFAQPWSRSARRFRAQVIAPPPESLADWITQLQAMPGLLQELKSESLQPFPTMLQDLPDWLTHSTSQLTALVEADRATQAARDTSLQRAQEELKALAEQLEAATKAHKSQAASSQVDHETREALLSEVRQEAFEEAYQEAYKKAQEESFQRNDDLLLIRAQPSHPMQTQDVLPVAFSPDQVDELEESLLQLKQEYTQLHTLFRLEQEQTQLSFESIFATLDERDAHERNELQTLQGEIESTRVDLHQRLEALQAEEELLQSTLTQVQHRFNLRSKIRQGDLEIPMSNQPLRINATAQGLHPPLKDPMLEDPMDGFAPPIERPLPPQTLSELTDSSVQTEEEIPKGEPAFMPVYRSEPTKLSKPPAKLNTTVAIDLLDEVDDDDEDFDDVEVIVGTPAVPSELELPMAGPSQSPPELSQLAQRVMKEPSIARLHPALQKDLMTFFTQLEQIDWFSGSGEPAHVHNLMQQHLRRLEPFAKAKGRPKPRLLGMFRSGTHQMHNLMASAEMLNGRVEEVFEASLSEQPDDWAGAGQAVWGCLRDVEIPVGRSRFQHAHWMVPWDTACDTILETTWIAANDVAWSVAREGPRFFASDAAADAANELQRAPARSAVWSVTWEFVRFAASGTVWSASNNAASDIANDIAWRLVQDRMADLDQLNPFSPLFRVWAAGWWPIHLASGDSILWAPLPDPNAMEEIWEVERGEYRP